MAVMINHGNNDEGDNAGVDNPGENNNDNDDKNSNNDNDGDDNRGGCKNYNDGAVAHRCTLFLCYLGCKI